MLAVTDLRRQCRRAVVQLLDIRRFAERSQAASPPSSFVTVTERLAFFWGDFFFWHWGEWHVSRNERMSHENRNKKSLYETQITHHMLKPSARRHCLCFSMSATHSGCSSPLEAMHVSRTPFVSGQAQHIFFGFPLASVGVAALEAGGGSGAAQPENHAHLPAMVTPRRRR